MDTRWMRRNALSERDGTIGKAVMHVVMYSEVCVCSFFSLVYDQKVS